MSRDDHANVGAGGADAHLRAHGMDPERAPSPRESSGLAPFHETVEYALRGIETWDEDGGCAICLTRDGHGQVWNDELEKNIACPVEDLRRALEPRMADVSFDLSREEAWCRLHCPGYAAEDPGGEHKSMCTWRGRGHSGPIPGNVRAKGRI